MIPRTHHKPITGTLHEDLVAPFRRVWRCVNNEVNACVEEPKEVALDYGVPAWSWTALTPYGLVKASTLSPALN